MLIWQNYGKIIFLKSFCTGVLRIFFRKFLTNIECTRRQTPGPKPSSLGNERITHSGLLNFWEFLRLRLLILCVLFGFFLPPTIFTHPSFFVLHERCLITYVSEHSDSHTARSVFLSSQLSLTSFETNLKFLHLLNKLRDVIKTFLLLQKFQGFRASWIVAKKLREFLWTAQWEI